MRRDERALCLLNFESNRRNLISGADWSGIWCECWSFDWSILVELMEGRRYFGEIFGK
jgi:hypothetical protein